MVSGYRTWLRELLFLTSVLWSTVAGVSSVHGVGISNMVKRTIVSHECAVVDCSWRSPTWRRSQLHVRRAVFGLAIRGGRAFRVVLFHPREACNV